MLPAYHLPKVGAVLRSMWERGWSFIKKAGTILVAIILLVVIALIIFSMIRDRKAGKSVICGGSCKTCGGCCSSCKGCPRSGMADPARTK